mmetsp:Transcript_977/g.3377  ORF Transcript_977/g.3377 Transcript_977/m.3377 type:complete len:87 (+) Transcript_977:954-1214(+)
MVRGGTRTSERPKEYEMLVFVTFLHNPPHTQYMHQKIFVTQCYPHPNLNCYPELFTFPPFHSIAAIAIIISLTFSSTKPTKYSPIS